MAESMEMVEGDAQEMQRTLMGITGADAPTAERLLEAVNGNMELAVALFFDGGGGGGGGDAAAMPPPAAPAGYGEPRPEAMALLGGTSGRPHWYEVVWGGAQPAQSWTAQPLAFQAQHVHPYDGVGLLQPMNGPCGVLAVINAVLVAQCRLAPGWGPDFQATEEHLAAALVAIFQTVAANSNGVVQLCSAWRAPGTSHADVEVVAVNIGPPLETAVRQVLPNLMAPGGLLLVVYTCVLTRGAGAIENDVRISGGDPPLIVPPHALCTSELLALMLKGVADGNVSAYAPTGGSKIGWRDHTSYALPIGMLSALEFPEFESAEGGARLPLADELKTPPTPVWIVHSATHFTFIFSPDASTDAQILSDTPGRFALYHWNGLPPGGPLMTTLNIDAVRGVSPPAAPVHTEGAGSYYKPLVNRPEGSEIDSVVQAHTGDKLRLPGQWDKWRYEVVLAMEDDAVDGVPRPAHVPLPPLFKLPEAGPDPTQPWRCATCYGTRYRTMNFGLNEAGAMVCANCGQAPHTGGFSLWLGYADLPESQKSVVSRRHAPKITSIVHTKWPGAVVSWNASQPAPSV